MNFYQIKSTLKITGKESKVFLPNEIFDDLQGYITNGTHLAYAYSYYYLTHFLYRNCKYLNTEVFLDGNVIKQVLGYAESNRTMNYITKKGGLLDEIGYTESTKNIPLGCELKEIEGLIFTMASDMPKEMLQPIPKMFFLKKPLKAFERTILKRNIETNQIEEVETQGTFYDVSNTHSVDFNVFMYCMANAEIGIMGFYLYSWLKHKHDIFRNGYDVSYEKLSAETGIPRRTMIKYLNALKGYNLISFKFNQQYYVIGMLDEDRMATTYYANSYSNFYEVSKPFKKMMVMRKDDYNKRNDIVVTMEQLPF